MMKLNESAIRTGIQIAALNKSPVKLKFKESSKFDPYFGKVIEINESSFVIEYHDNIDTVQFSDIDNIIN